MKYNFGIVFSFSPLNSRQIPTLLWIPVFNHPVKILKNKYEKTVVYPAGWISNGDDHKLVYHYEERL